jgi:PTH1 family peptidyl-tRNA hydrolase
MKFLIVGLGNIGEEYAHTRHNIGFDIADALASKFDKAFTPDRYVDYVMCSIKGKQLHIIKPTTYMNLSGKAVRYWMEKLNIPVEQILILVDDFHGVFAVCNFFEIHAAVTVDTPACLGLVTILRLCFS